MIELPVELEMRLDDVWRRLQRVERIRTKLIGQAGVDTACIERLEQVVGYLEAEANLRPENR